MDAAVTPALASGPKPRRRVRIDWTRTWILSVGVPAAACLLPCLVRAQSIDVLAASPPQGAQPAGKTSRWQIVPQISLSETYSDNLTQARPGSAQSGWSRELSPGIYVSGAGPRVKGQLDYRLRDIGYTSQSQLNNRQNLLSSSATIEAAENWLFVDARASITQQSTSAFGVPAQSLAGSSANRTETTVYQLSPYVRGKISDIAAYQAGFNQTGSRTGNGASPATETAEWVARFRNTPSSSKLGWSFDSDALTIRNDAVGTRVNGRMRGSLIYDIYPEVRASILYGRENSSYAAAATQRGDTPGFGLEWSPGARTQIAAVKERRSFGESHSLLLSHRTPLMELKYTDDGDVSVMANQIASGDQGSIQTMMSDLLTASIPDPAARLQAVRSLLEQTGASTAPTGGFISSGIFKSRNRMATAVLLGRRNTMTMTLTRHDSQNISLGTASATDSLSTSSNISQRTASLSWAYKLSPYSTLTNSVSSLRSSGSGGVSAESGQYVRSAFLSSRISAKATASIGVMTTKFFSSAVPGYRENAFVGTLSMSF